MKKPVLTLLMAIMVCLPTMTFAGQPFPDNSMTGQLSAENKAYLGVSSDTFKLTDIKADYVFVEAFSMYCPVCQRDAPRVNEAYEAITQADPKGTVKFLGIGLGNTAFEIKFYKDKYGVTFPLVRDENYIVHKALGEVGTPTFYLVKLSGGTSEILFKKEGEAEDKAALVQMIKDKAGLH
ncbi:TlpA family protein disulfide reductase [Pseudodesulfovibrio sp.]|nr:TlpA family protein disulfide reductase [Pseudodesulfovibrio sp.]